MGTNPTKRGALRALSLYMTPLLLAAMIIVPAASAEIVPKKPNAPCPGPGGTHGGWQWLPGYGGPGTPPTFRCSMGPGVWLYCQYISEGVDNCWTVSWVADRDVVSPAAKTSYPVVLPPTDPLPIPPYCEDPNANSYWQYLYCVLL